MNEKFLPIYELIKENAVFVSNQGLCSSWPRVLWDFQISFKTHPYCQVLFSILNRMSLFLFIAMHSWQDPLSGGVRVLNQMPSKLKVMSQGLAMFCFGFLFIPFSCTALNFKHTFPDTLTLFIISQTSVFKSKIWIFTHPPPPPLWHVPGLKAF